MILQTLFIILARLLNWSSKEEEEIEQKLMMNDIEDEKDFSSGFEGERKEKCSRKSWGNKFIATRSSWANFYCCRDNFLSSFGRKIEKFFGECLRPQKWFFM